MGAKQGWVQENILPLACEARDGVRLLCTQRLPRWFSITITSLMQEPETTAKDLKCLENIVYYTLVYASRIIRATSHMNPPFHTKQREQE